jgi:ABC-type nitrate/sulfonate/bicarbonate transport system substrate-binding protein
MMAALEQKRVDAICAFEPFSSDFAAKGARTIAYPYDAIAKQFSVTAWFVPAPWLEGHRDAVQRFAQVHRTATDYANTHLPDMMPIVASATGDDRRGHSARAACKGCGKRHTRTVTTADRRSGEVQRTRYPDSGTRLLYPA